MEDHSTKHKIAVLSKVSSLTEGLVNAIHPFSAPPVLLCANHTVNSSLAFITEELLLDDIVLTDRQLVGKDTIIYVDNIDSEIKKEAALVKSLTELSNLINICIENGCEKFIYITAFTSEFGRHFYSAINEDSIWESSMNLDLNSKYIHLAQQEVYRGIHEGLKSTILSCGHILTENSNLYNKNFITTLLKSEAGSYHFVHMEDILSIVKQLILADELPEKLLLVSESKSRLELEKMVEYNPSFKSRMLKLFKAKPANVSRISIENQKTRSFYNKPFIEINSLLQPLK